MQHRIRLKLQTKYLEKNAHESNKLPSSADEDGVGWCFFFNDKHIQGSLVEGNVHYKVSTILFKVLVNPHVALHLQVLPRENQSNMYNNSRRQACKCPPLSLQTLTNLIINI